MRYKQDRDDAAGMLNVGFLKILQNISKYNSSTPFIAWIKRIMINIDQLINPYLEKLAKSDLNSQQTAYLEILQSHIDEIVSPFTRNLSIRQWNLTPTEMRVAILVKQGRKTTQIAKLLELSPRTVEAHRRGIRVKFGLARKKTNLMSYLRSI